MICIISFHIQSISVLTLNICRQLIVKLNHVHITCVYTLLNAIMFEITANDYCSNYYTRDLHIKHQHLH